MSKIHNFGAGPAKMPEEVYDILKQEFTNFEGTGISLLETSHRTPAYSKLNKDIQDVVRKLLNVPNNYKIIFLSGGGQGQFSAVPLNLMSRTGTADYVVTGAWSAKAAKEAKKYGKVNMVLPPTDRYVDIPDQSTWKLDPNASYVHICTNETIHGVEFDFIPDTKGVPLVADMSSNFMSKKINVSKFGVIYGGAQKNIGTAGVALVIVREDLLNQALPICPSILDWTINVKADSILNTPPMFAIQVMGRVLQWIDRKGGLEAMANSASKKSSLIYDVIENSNGFYFAPVAKNVRSKMNIPFRVGSASGDDALEKEFLKGAEALDLIQLKGHRDVGGIRASTYNAVTVEEVENLVSFMKEFQKKHAKNVPNNYKILFLSGGGQGQFSAVPLNLMSRTGTADYVVTGIWSVIAAKEAKKYGKVNMVLPPTDTYVDIPDQSTWQLDPNASYVHICTNETIHGVEFGFIPDTKGVPLVADMSSNIMSKKIDVSKFGVIYGGAQKNIGTAGVTLVIVREDLLNQALPICPSILDWTINAKADSILNTPPMYAIQVMGRVLQWIDRKGGLETMANLATKKSSLIYNEIDNSNGFYFAPVAKNVRSKMNIPFRVGSAGGDDALEKEFLKEAEALGLIQLKGHRLVGGIRASTYNAVTVEEVEILVSYMKHFQEKHFGK